MTAPTALPIARLRAAGAKVSTIIGHWPKIGDWIYGVTPPAAYSLDHLMREIRDTSPDVRVTVAPDRGRIIVSMTSYRKNEPLPSRTERERRGALVAATLHRLADKIGA